MGRKRVKIEDKIVCNMGNTTVECPNMVARFESVPWLVKLSPSLKLPGLRHSDERYIYVNERKFGKAYYTEACIPIPEYMDTIPGIGTVIVNYLKVHLGLFSERHQRGYFYVRLGRQKFAVTRRIAENLCVYGKVYQYLTGDLVGTYGFNPEFDKVLIQSGELDLPNTMKVIVGYMADVSIYSIAVASLNRNIEILNKNEIQ